MPTNEERREVAARLRNAAIENTGFFEYSTHLGEAICECVRLVSGHKLLVKRGLNRLADLIEPEERTCTFSIAQGCVNRPICSRCGYEAGAHDCDHWLENDVSFWEYSRNFCDGCGARVVKE